MFVMRAIRKSDVNSFIKLSFEAKVGITSLPKNEAKLTELLNKAVESFAKKVTTPGYEIYLFILEDLSTKTACGISGIHALTGGIQTFKIRSQPLEKKFPEIPDEVEILEPVLEQETPTEICSLFLDPKYRKEGLGKLLSFSRFLFMANFPERFTETVYALMRSYLDEQEENPFWNHVGRKFFDVSFKELIKRKDQGHDVFPPLLAKFPILTSFLPSDAKQAIGNVSSTTLPALHMLNNQGFMYKNEIDALDGGPKIEAELKKIKTIQESKTAKVSKIEEGTFEPYLISNCLLNFRCCYGSLKVDGGDFIISKETAEGLHLQTGDFFRYVRL